MTTGSFMKVKSFAECSLQCFWLALSGNWSWKPIFNLFESGRFTQVLLYIVKGGHKLDVGLTLENNADLDEMSHSCVCLSESTLPLLTIVRGFTDYWKIVGMLVSFSSWFPRALNCIILVASFSADVPNLILGWHISNQLLTSVLVLLGKQQQMIFFIYCQRCYSRPLLVCDKEILDIYLFPKLP